MDQELRTRLDSLEKTVNDIARSIKQIKRVFFWMIILSVLVAVVPLIGLAFAIPQFLSSYSTILQ